MCINYAIVGGRRKWSLWRSKCSVDIEMPADFELTRFGSSLGHSYDDVAASLPSSFPALTDRVALGDVLTWKDHFNIHEQVSSNGPAASHGFIRLNFRSLSRTRRLIPLILTNFRETSKSFYKEISKRHL